MHNGPDRATPPNHLAACPLARDESGNALDLPAGAVAWRVRRKTGGRPRLVLAVDKQPMQVPLGYTIVDLEDILTPGAYLLDIVDTKGDPLGLTIGASIGQLRNGDGSGGEDDNDQTPTVAPILPSTGSETRLVLEANVRATQMAFQHNQKTLELGLRMAETLRDGVRVLADSQAEWIKSLSSARGFFRNAAPPPPAALPPPSEDQAEDQHDDDVEETPPSLVETIGPLVAIAAEKITTTIMQMKMGGAAGGGGASTDMQLGDLLDWRRPAQRSRAARDAEDDSSTVDQGPGAAASATEAGVRADPKTQMHFMAIMAALSEDERRHAQAAAALLTPEQQLVWMDQLKASSVAEGVQAVRDEIAKHRAA